MNSIEYAFIEGAARALYVSAWAEREERTCVRCGDEIHGSDETPERRSMCDLELPCRGRSFAGVELMDVAPETPDYVRLVAAKLLGMLEVKNGTTLACITTAAARADLEARWSANDDEEVGLLVTNLGEKGAALSMAAAKDIAQLSDDEAREFGHYVAMRAMGHGVSWFDDHAKFDFVVPHFEFTMFDLED